MKTRLMAMLTVVVVLFAFSTSAYAERPTEVSGTYSLAGSTLEYIRWRPAGDNCKLECGFTYPFAGDLVGTATFDYSIMVHGPCTPDEPPPGPGVYESNLKARGTFTGEVLGEFGTFDFTYAGKEWPFEVPGDLGVAARIVILSGTGDLENLHGVLDVTYFVGDAYDGYAGRVHFDP